MKNSHVFSMTYYFTFLTEEKFVVAYKSIKRLNNVKALL